MLPVSTADAERTFSKVQSTLSAVRSTMCEDRLEALVMCQTHRDILPSTEEIVSFFSTSGSRRLDFKLSI